MTMNETLYEEARRFLARSLQSKQLPRESLHPWRRPWEYTYLHSLRVEALVFRLLENQQAALSADEQQALRLSAILHDVARLEDTPDHAALSAEIAAGWLRDHPELAAQVAQPQRVLDLIARHSQKDQPEPDDLACALLKDADLLDEIGAVSILMSANWIDHNTPFFFYDLHDRLSQQELDYCTKIQARLNTSAARAYLQQKQDFIQAFIRQLETELVNVPRDAPSQAAPTQALDQSAGQRATPVTAEPDAAPAAPAPGETPSAPSTPTEAPPATPLNNVSTPTTPPPSIDKQPFIDRMLETANLTDQLEDADANWLLDWGAGQLDTILAGAADADTAAQRVTALMAVMRKINRIAGSYADKGPQSLAGDLAELHSLFQQAYHPDLAESQPAPADLESAAGRLADMDTRQVLEFLTRWYSGGSAQ